MEFEENKIGRPELLIPLSELKDLMSFYPTLEEVAHWFDCSSDTVERRIRDEWKMTFKEFRVLNSGKTRLLLKRKAISKALEDDNDKMLIFCLKALTEMTDSAQIPTEKSETVIRLAYSEQFL